MKKTISVFTTVFLAFLTSFLVFSPALGAEKKSKKTSSNKIMTNVVNSAESIGYHVPIPTNKVTIRLTDYGVVYTTPGDGKYSAFEYVCDFKEPNRPTEVVGLYTCGGDGCSNLFKPSDDGVETPEDAEFKRLVEKFNQLGVHFQFEQSLGNSVKKATEMRSFKFTLFGTSFSPTSNYILKQVGGAGSLQVINMGEFSTEPPERGEFSLYELNGQLLPVIETTETDNSGEWTVGTVKVFRRSTRFVSQNP